MNKAKKVFTNAVNCCNNIANEYKKRKLNTEINRELCRMITRRQR